MIIPMHPTWPGMEEDVAVVRRFNALFKIWVSASTPDDEADRAAEALDDMWTDYCTADIRMEAGLGYPRRPHPEHQSPARLFQRRSS